MPSQQVVPQPEISTPKPYTRFDNNFPPQGLFIKPSPISNPPALKARHLEFASECSQNKCFRDKGALRELPWEPGEALTPKAQMNQKDRALARPVLRILRRDGAIDCVEREYLGLNSVQCGHAFLSSLLQHHVIGR